MSSNKIAVLLDWCADNGVRIDSRIQVVDMDSTHIASCSDGSDIPFDGSTDFASISRKRGIAVYSREDFIECPCTLVHIPKAAVLSVRSCSLARQIPAMPYGHGAHLALAFGLYGELLRGSRSRWFGYLQSLPRETVDIAAFWGTDDVVDFGPCMCSDSRCASLSWCGASGRDRFSPKVTSDGEPNAERAACVRMHDGQSAQTWLQATEADRVLRGIMDEIHQYYFNAVEPTLRAVCNNAFQIGDHPPVENGRKRNLDRSDPEGEINSRDISFTGFCHAYSLVSSRAFWIDAYHGLAMVPIADAFNHANSNHVQMESDYDVCIECGSLAECEHDRDTEDQAAALPSTVHPLSHKDAAAPGRSTSPADDYLEMRTVQPIPPRCEVFNTYGALSNAVLLSRYGFMLPGNEVDTVRMVDDPRTSVERLLYARDENAMRNVEVECSMEEKREFEDPSRDITQQDDESHDQPATSSPGHTRWEELKNLSGTEPADRIREDLVNWVLRMFACMARAWSKDAAWDEHDNGLVFNPESPCPTTICLVDGPVQLSQDLVVNSDGRLSHLLWLLCILVAVFQTRPYLDPAFLGMLETVESNCDSIRALTELKARLLRVQRYAERRRHDGSSTGDMALDDEDDGSDDGDGDDSSDSKHGPPTTSLALLPPSVTSSCPFDKGYDTETDGFTHAVVTATSSGLATHSSSNVAPHLSVTACRGSSGPVEDVDERSAVTMLADPARNTSSSFSSHAPLYGSFKAPAVAGAILERHVAGQLCQGTTTTPPFITALSSSQQSQATVSSGSRLRSFSAEGERPPKRARHLSHFAVSREDQEMNVLGSPTISLWTGEERPFGQPGQGSSDHGTSIGDVDQRVAIALARVVVCLCNERYRPPVVKEGQRGVGLTATELGDVLDETPDWMPRTRSALQLAVGERSIVESCGASWGAILGEDDIWI